MIQRECEVSVRYSEVDSMGIVFHSRYIEYYDFGRNEFIASLGVPLTMLESVDNIMVPVLEVKSTYLSPAYFGDKLTIRTTLKELPKVKAHFYTEVYRDGELINKGSVTLAFINGTTRKPVRAPQRLLEALQREFNQ